MFQILQILDQGADQKCWEVTSLRIVLNPWLMGACRQVPQVVCSSWGVPQRAVFHTDPRSPQWSLHHVSTATTALQHTMLAHSPAQSLFPPPRKAQYQSPAQPHPLVID